MIATIDIIIIGNPMTKNQNIELLLHSSLFLSYLYNDSHLVQVYSSSSYFSQWRISSTNTIVNLVLEFFIYYRE